MAKGVYGNKFSRNGEQFESFIKEFCNWDDAERVSLQQIALFLKKIRTPINKKFKEYIFSELAKYPSSQPVPFSIDPFMGEIRPYISSDTLYRGIKIDYFKHVNLLWRYRNALVHEARSIGADQLFDFEYEPHYIHYFELIKDGEGRVIQEKCWEKYYPLSFFINLVDNAISNIKFYLVKNEINPFMNYEFEPLWIRVRS